MELLSRMVVADRRETWNLELERDGTRISTLKTRSDADVQRDVMLTMFVHT